MSEHFDLEFLYRYYQGEITYQKALAEKDIHFCRVRAVSELSGIRKGEPVTSYCIRRGKTLWFSKKKYIKVDDAKTVILDEWDAQHNNFSNPNTKKIINTLFSIKNTG